MKKQIAFFLLLAGCCLSVLPVDAQPPLRLYPYRMNPRNHPDDLRHHVKAPDRSLFGDRMQFISLRDLSGEAYKERIDLWTRKDKLGDILWVSYPLIYQPNLKEVVREIKERNLYLFDLWGYIPGSGPGGYWTQFRIPDGVLDLFESELGERWLGMDNGEQDGRYTGSFAPAMYPAGADRLQQYFSFQRHFEELGNQLGNKLATLVSLNFGHYFLKEGIYTLIGAETAQGLPNSQIYYSFIRGAGKQYGVLWFGNASVWNRWGYKTYGEDATNIDDEYNSGGPLKGTSLSLLKRLMYHHIFYNCVAAGFEGSMRDASGRLSPIGKIQQNAVKWVERNGDPGVLYTPVALMNDFFSGWSFPRHLYSGQAYKVWGNLPYEPSDYLTDGLLDIFYPGYQDASYFRDERGFIAPTPYGDMADCLLSDAPEWVLRQYPVLIIADEIRGGLELNDKLENYIASGGHLVITAGSLRNLPQGLAGIKTAGEAQPCTGPVRYRDETIQEKGTYKLMPLSFPPEARVIQRAGERPAAVEVTSGAGKLTVIASPFGLCEEPQCTLPVKVEEEKPLAKPYPLLEHTRRLIAGIAASARIFSTNPELSLVTCVRNENDFTVLIANNGWQSRPFEIRAEQGRIEWIKELPIDCDERKAVGYTPKTVTIPSGKNTATTIAGGDVRTFRIRLADTDFRVIPESRPAPNPAGRALVLRNSAGLKEEILSRPTFFSRYDRAVIDWRYLAAREKEALAAEGNWIKRQKLGVTVDLSSGLNLYPDLRIVNNDSVYYAKSMRTIRAVIDKMPLLNADRLIITSQRSIENNYTMKRFNRSLVASFRELADYAAAKNIRLLFRPVHRRIPETLPEAIGLIREINRDNFTLAPSLALLLERPESLAESIRLLREINVRDFIVSAPAWDMHRQLWNSNEPVYRYPDKTLLKEIASHFPDAAYILDGLYENQDEEYLDSKILEQLVSSD